MSSTWTVERWLPTSAPPPGRGVNQRRYYRVLMRRMEAWLTRLDAQAVKRLSVRVVNLSGGGAMIVAPPRITRGDRVCLELPRRFGIGPLKLHGEVVWIEEEKDTCRAGIKFNISERVRDQVIRIVFAQELRSAG